MALRTSTGHKNRMLGENGVDTGADGFRGIYKGCCIELYSGSQPTSADSASTGYTLLGRITLNGGAFTEGDLVTGNGLEWDAPSGGAISKPAADAWQGSGLATGTIGWFRCRGNATDDGSASTTLPRFDGTVGITSGDLRLTVVSVTSGTPIAIQSATFAFA